MLGFFMPNYIDTQINGNQIMLCVIKTLKSVAFWLNVFSGSVLIIVVDFLLMGIGWKFLCLRN
jgi:hypothetical protein